MAEIPVAAQAHGCSRTICGYRFIRYMKMTGPNFAAQLFSKLFRNSRLTGHRLPGWLLEIEKLGKAVQAEYNGQQRQEPEQPGNKFQ